MSGKLIIVITVCIAITFGLMAGVYTVRFREHRTDESPLVGFIAFMACILAATLFIGCVFLVDQSSGNFVDGKITQSVGGGCVTEYDGRFTDSDCELPTGMETITIGQYFEKKIIGSAIFVTMAAPLTYSLAGDAIKRFLGRRS